MNIDQRTKFVKDTATDLGFAFCGISNSEFLEEEAPRLENWLIKNYHGGMKYMENNFDKRLNPNLLVPGAKVVLSLIFNYFPKQTISGDSGFKVAKYAYGEDYHFVIKDKLKEFIFRIKEKLGDVNGRVFVDSAPVLERVWAARSGIGWIGKNSLLLNKSMGSFFFLAELILDLELSPDSQVNDYCGTCTACMDACPTEAIAQPYIVDGSRCISYFTIELKEEIPEEVRGKFENWIFGCDICQDVCPWNRFAQPHSEPRLNPNSELTSMTESDWKEITEEVFEKVFHNSALKRTQLKGIKRNISFISTTVTTSWIEKMK